MFSCCCANRKALKKEQENAEKTQKEKTSTKEELLNQNLNGKSQQAQAKESLSPKSPAKNDKSSSSDDDNNLSSLILTDGLVEEINFQLKSQFDCGNDIEAALACENCVESQDEAIIYEKEETHKNYERDFENMFNNSGASIATPGSGEVAIDASLDSKFQARNESTPLSSCFYRRDSARASIKKKVRCSETNEVIPTPNCFINSDEYVEVSHEDDDDVFCDKAPAQTSRGNMCTPYVERKGSLPGFEPLPDWFSNSRVNCSTPPTTPLDCLALKRQRLFNDLLDAANAAVNHRVRFNPAVTEVPRIETDDSTICDSSVSQPKELINLISRLESIVTRLENNVPNQIADSGISTGPQVSSSYSQTDLTSPDERYLPTVLPSVLPHIEQRLEKLQKEQNQNKLLEELHQVKAMSVNAYEDIILGSLAQFLDLSKKIGDDVATQADFVKKAFDAQLQFMTLASQSAQPDQNDLPKLLQPTSDQINAIQTFREKHRTSKFFNHLSAVSESIPALGWVCVSPTPGPHVKEMNDAGQFYTNRVLKEWKEKDVTHANWAKTWVQTLTELQQYIKQYHTTGIVWAGKTKATANGTSGGPPPPPPMGNLPPPPPMPAFDLAAAAADDDRNALFAQINQGSDITKSLKKVTSDMQTHKNPTLREGPAPFKATGPTPFKPAVAVKPSSAPAAKPPVFSRDGKKWLIEYQKNNNNLLVENAEMNNVVYMFKSEGSTLTVKGKINSIVIDSCKKCSVVFDTLVSSIEFVNCQSVQMQVLGKVPTISIDKTDGCQMYLNKDSLAVEIVSSKSSEMNVMLPTPAGDDYVESPIPEQFKTVVSGNTLQTSCVESLG